MGYFKTRQLPRSLTQAVQVRSKKPILTGNRKGEITMRKSHKKGKGRKGGKRHSKRA